MKRLLLGLFILFTFTGCFLKSVHPLVSEKDAVLMPGLEGTWLNDDELWTFINDPRNVTNLDLSKYELDVEFEEGEEIEETIYLVLVQKLDENTVSDEEPYVLLGRIVQLNDHYFLDLSLFDFSLGEDDLISAHQFPVHTFSKVTVDGDDPNIEFFKSAWIKELIESNRVRIKYEKVDESILITASTKELQKFVSKYAEDEDAFDDPVILERTHENF